MPVWRVFLRSEKFNEGDPIDVATVLSAGERTLLGNAAVADSPTMATRRRHATLLPYGMLMMVAGLAMYLLGVAMVVPRYLLALDHQLKPVSEWLVWYSGVPIVLATGYADLPPDVPAGIKRLGKPFSQMELAQVVSATTAPT